jgi:hypothetical protein
MLGAAILCLGLGSVGLGEYARPFGARELDQATLDAEGFGDKKALKREDDGLRVTLAPGDAEAGWKTPPALRIGGDFSIVATLSIARLAKPGHEDGVAIGLAVATQNVDQPEATLLRQVEPDGAEVYRPVDKGSPQNMMMQQQMFDPFGQPLAKPAKPPRPIFPARGKSVRFELRREGQTLHYEVTDELGGQAREIGQYAIGPGEIAGVKLFASNRSGTEPVEVLFRDLEIRAERITGLGTAVRTIRGKVVHGDPTRIEAGVLLVGPSVPGEAQPAQGNAQVQPVVVVPTAPGAPGTMTTVVVAAPAAPAVVIAPVAAPAVPAPAAEPAKVAAAAGAPSAAPVAPPPPKARIPLEEVESVSFERASVLTGRFLGQPNVDTTGPRPLEEENPRPKAGAGENPNAPPPGTVVPVAIPKVEPKANGVRDIHLALSGLRNSAIRQVTVTIPTDKQPTTWQLDTSGAKNWPLTVSRSGVESTADLFLEPPAAAIKDKDFAITLMYADNQNATAQIKATANVDAKLAYDPEAPAPALDARVFLTGQDQLYGKLESIGEETLRLTAPWGEKVDVPLARVVAIYVGLPEHKETAESFAKRIKTRGSEDLLLARTKDGEVLPISGIVEGSTPDKLTFRYREKSRTLPLKMVEGFILAARPDPKPPTDLRATFTLNGGLVLTGKWVTLEPAAWGLETAWGQVLKLPPADVRSVRFRGGGMTYLSDLEPSRVEETPYFGRRNPYRRDQNLAGEPIKLAGRVYERGIAVHSRSALTYDLEKRFTGFEVVLGFDEASRKRGRVDARILADGKEIYANPDLRADAPPQRLSLPVANVEQLQLIVDFGLDEDTGDRVLWADARLYRTSTTKPTTEPRPASGP